MPKQTQYVTVKTKESNTSGQSVIFTYLLLDITTVSRRDTSVKKYDAVLYDAANAFQESKLEQIDGLQVKSDQSEQSKKEIHNAIRGLDQRARELINELDAKVEKIQYKSKNSYKQKKLFPIIAATTLGVATVLFLEHLSHRHNHYQLFNTDTYLGILTAVGKGAISAGLGYVGYKITDIICLARRIKTMRTKEDLEQKIRCFENIVEKIDQFEKDQNS